MALSEDCQIIKDTIDIKEFCEQRYEAVFVESTKGWFNTNCLMPDHEDSSPSFGVNPEKGTYSCFGCGAYGTVIDLVMAIEKMRLTRAVEFLLDYLHLQPAKGNPQFHKIRKLLKARTRSNKDVVLMAKIKQCRNSLAYDDNIDYDKYYTKVCGLLGAYESNDEEGFIDIAYGNKY